MNFENLPNQITDENEHLFLAVRNKLQVDLAKRYAESIIPGIAENNEEDEQLNEIVNYWMNTYSKIFSQVFKDLYHEDKDLFHEYLENPEKVLGALEELMKQKNVSQ